MKENKILNFIFGAKGFAKEVDWLIYDIFKLDMFDFRTNFFVVEDNSPMIGKVINNSTIISEKDFLNNYKDAHKNCFIGIGSPKIRAEIVKFIKENTNNSYFPNIIHPSADFDKRRDKIIMGEGNIICAKNVLTTDIKIGNFVHINLDCTIGHDSIIGDYTTISPGVHISGNVTIEEFVFLGTGMNILENIKIVSHCKIGAGATLTKSALETGTYVGIPATKIK